MAIEAQKMEMQVFLSDTISKEVDCGRCTYLSLRNGVHIWAEKIHLYLNKNKVMKLNDSKMNRFNKKHMTEQFEQIYKGD